MKVLAVCGSGMGTSMIMKMKKAFIMKVLAVCGSGMGTSMIMKMKMKKVLDKLGINADVDSCSVAEAKSNLNNKDVVVCSVHMAGELTVKAPTILIAVQNMLNETELEDKLKAAGIGV